MQRLSWINQAGPMKSQESLQVENPSQPEGDGITEEYTTLCVLCVRYATLVTLKVQEEA